MHFFGEHAGAQRRQRRRLAVDGDLINLSLRTVRYLVDPESTVEAELELVKIGHPAKTQEHRFSCRHYPVGGTVVGLDDVFAGSHDLQEMGVGRHFAVCIVQSQQLGRLARSRLRGRQRDLVLGDTGADGIAAGVHHRTGDLPRMSCQAQLLGRLDHPHFGNQGSHILEHSGLDQRVDIGTHHRRHLLRLDCDSGRAF